MTPSYTNRLKCLLASALLLLPLYPLAPKAVASCAKDIQTLYFPIASEAFIEALSVDFESYLQRLTDCKITSQLAIDFQDFIKRLNVDHYDLVLAPAYSVQVIASRLGYRPLVSTEKLFSAQLISHQSFNEEDLIAALVGKTLYTPDVLSGVFAALEQWLYAQDLRYRVRLAPGYPHDHLVKAVATKQMDFAVVADVFTSGDNLRGINTLVHLPSPLGPVYLLHSSAFDTDFVQYLQRVLLDYDSTPWSTFLKSKRVFVPANTYPSSFFTDTKSRFMQMIAPDFFQTDPASTDK